MEKKRLNDCIRYRGSVGGPILTHILSEIYLTKILDDDDDEPIF